MALAINMTAFSGTYPCESELRSNMRKIEEKHMDFDLILM